MKYLIVLLISLIVFQFQKQKATTHADAVGAPTGASDWCKTTPNPPECEGTINSFPDQKLKATPSGAAVILLGAAIATIQPIMASLTNESIKAGSPPEALEWFKDCEDGLTDSVATLGRIYHFMESGEKEEDDDPSAYPSEIQRAADDLKQSCSLEANLPPVVQHINDMVGILCDSASAASIILNNI